MSTFIRTALASAAALFPFSAFACASCGCTIGGDWESQGLSSHPGLRIELRQDYLDQSQLRSGTGTVDRGAIPLPTDREIEQDTKNLYTTLGFDYSPNSDWGVNVQLPYINRAHTTIAEGDTDVSSSHTQSIGDMRVLGRYQGFTEQRDYGIQFGLKLPTGDYRKTFDTGPQAGQPLDRGLQPGSGTTDLMVGAFHVGSLSDNWDYFTQGMLQGALDSKDGYKPGASLNLNAGLRYMANDKYAPELQINARTVRRDSGVNADVENSGGTLVYLTPGVSGSIAEHVDAFAFLQLPLYQRVNGYQLTPRYTLSAGVRYQF